MNERLCQKDKIPNHEDAAKILKHLKTNPVICDDCEIKPCVFALYLYGKP